MRLIIIGCILLASFGAAAQQTRSISGTITDKTNGELLLGVAVIDTVTGTAAFTNIYGFFSIDVPKQDAYLKIMSMGYETKFVLVKSSFKEVLEL